MKFEIENDIPLPAAKSGRKKKEIHDYPLPLFTLEIKDSFFINEPPTQENLKKYKNMLRRICIALKRDLNETRSFIVDQYNEGIRVWRKS